MTLTPGNIKTREFNKSMRGYDVMEVNAYLEKLANEVEDLLAVNERLMDEVEDYKRSVDNYKKIEKNLQDSLLKVQNSSQPSLESIRKQTAMIIKEAELKAQQIIDNAKENANEIRNAVLTLREEKDLLISKLKAIIKTQGYLLEGKITTTDKEIEKPKQQASKNKLEVDVDDIVNKLL